MGVSKKRKTTKPFRQNSTTGKIASKDEVANNPSGTTTQTVVKDKDGFRSDKGRKRTPKAKKPPESDVKANKGDIKDNTDTDWKQIAEQNVAERGKVSAAEVRELNEKAGLTGAMVSGFLNEERGGSDVIKQAEDLHLVPLPCLTDRPNKPRTYTCLDEVEEAIDHPERFTEPQITAIISDDNLCENCKANAEVK